MGKLRSREKSGEKRGTVTSLSASKNPVGRPKIELDYTLIAELAQIQCTQAEIAAVLGVSVDTLQRDHEFCGIYKKGIEGGKTSLRRMQWKSAEEGSVPAQIWLGKNYLGQKENPTESNGSEMVYKVVFTPEAND